jgi:tetratricopeptide (TPR) repeat protein
VKSLAISVRAGAILFVLMLFSAGSVLAECSPSEMAAARQAYDTAYAFVQQGKWNTAIRSLVKAQEQCPEHWQSKELLAQAYLRTKDYKKSVEEYKALIQGKYKGSVDSTETRVLSGYGFALLKAANVKDAEAVYLAYIKKNPKNEDPYKRIVYVYEATKRYDDAIEFEKKLYLMNPEEHEYTKKIGDLYLKKGDNASAQEWYSKAAAEGIATRGAYELGLEHMKAGRFEAAARAFQDYVAGKPKNASGWQNLGYCYTKMGQNKKAIEAYETALSLEAGRHSVAASLGFLYLENQRVDDAEKIARNAIDNWPSDDPKKPGMYYLMGQVLEKKGDYLSAIDSFSNILDDPQWGDRAAAQVDRQRQLIAIQRAREEQKKQGG